MKSILLLIFTVLTLSAIGQELYDVRKVKWGMTQTEVLSSEYPLRPTIINDDKIEFDNVVLSNNLKALVYFGFKNAKLDFVAYTIYLPPRTSPCENIEPLSNKVRYSRFVRDALAEKGLKCNLGWYLRNCDKVNSFPVGYVNCNTDESTIEKMAQAARIGHCSEIVLNFESERNRISFTFWEWQNSKEAYQSLWPDCNDNFYNILCNVLFEPNLKLKNQLDKGDF